MINQNFYKEVDNMFSTCKKGVAGTITDITGKLKGKANLIGIKFILNDNKEINFYGNQIFNEKFNSLFKLLKEGINYKEIMKLNQPLLKEIEINNSSKVEIYFEPLLNKPRLIIFGAGHVSLSVAKLGKMIDFEVTVIDDREDLVNQERFPNADYLICKQFEDYLSQLEIRSNDYLVIVTRGHKFDYRVLKEVISSKAKYIGMIGSDRKVKILFDQLHKKDGITKELIEQVSAPIGLEIGSETPEEIAVSIVSELIKVRRKKSE